MKILSLILFALTLFFLSSCGHNPKEENPSKSTQTFENWEQEIKLNVDIFESDSHNAYVDIFVNELALKPYETRAASFPIGSVVYKPLYSDMQKSYLARVVIMIKMSKGYDTKNGDWWYGVTDASGKELWHEGRIQHCIDCHAFAKATDYMFSESVMEEVEIQKGLRVREVFNFD